MKKNIKNMWRPLIAKLVAALCLLAAVQVAIVDPAFAQTAGGNTFAPVAAVFQAIVDFVTGGAGRLFAIIAVMALGFLAFAGRLSWFMAGCVILGIGLIFGSSAIVDTLISTAGK